MPAILGVNIGGEFFGGVGGLKPWRNKAANLQENLLRKSQRNLQAIVLTQE